MSNLSIRRKILIAFGLIAAMLIVQALISVNSVSSLETDFIAVKQQGLVRQTALNIDILQGSEVELLDSWLSGTTEAPRSDFNSTAINTEDSFSQLVENIELLKNIDTSVDLNISVAESIYESLVEEREEYLELVYHEFHRTPSLDIINTIEEEAQNVVTTYYNTTSILAEYMLTSDQDLAELFDFTIEGNLITLISVNVVNFRNAYQVLPNITYETFGQDINNTLYLEIQEIENTQLTLSQSDADGFISSITSDMGNIDDISNITESQFNSLRNDYEQLLDAVSDLDQGISTIVDIMTRERQQLLSTYTSILGIKEQMSILIEQLNLWATDGAEKLTESFILTSAIQETLLVAVVVLALILVVVLTILLNRLITLPITGVTRWSEFIAEGDLSKVKKMDEREDEIGILESNFKKMNVNLRRIISQVQKSAALIADTSEDLASNTQEINATAEEVSAIAQTMAKGSTEQAEIITTIVQELQKSSEVVESVVSAITANLAIIKDLSEQTNILALNTSIEAANAGEFGRGFTVIAENIRKMSDQTRRTSQRVSSTSREILEELQASFAQIAEMIENVASVSEETAASAEEVAASAEEMTASMESIASNSSILNEQSAESLDVVSQFRLEE